MAEVELCRLIVMFCVFIELYIFVEVMRSTRTCVHQKFLDGIYKPLAYQYQITCFDEF